MPLPSELQERHARLMRKMHEVFGAGLELKKRLEQGQRPRFDVEWNRLRSLLIAGGELDYDPLYRGDLAQVQNVRASSSTLNISNMYLGVQYVLACWLDELFINHSPRWWSEQWVTQSIEVSLLGGAQEREWRFWVQARMAEGTKGCPEALECFLWAVMLGFRGRPEAELARVDPINWVENTRRRVLATRQSEFPEPPSVEAPSGAGALRGQSRLRGMFRWALILIAISSFILTIAITSALSRELN